MTRVKCKICNEVQEKKHYLIPISNALQKHVGRQKATSTHQGWLLVNTTSARLASILRMSGNMLRFTGELLWLNKLQMEIL
jgi:hypothetical protein